MRDGRRNHRRRYSVREAQIGMVLLLGLVAVAFWVIWKGANPDPSLFEVPLSSLDAGTPELDRGPLPGQLAADGWREGELSQFDASDLYVKINGREDYYKSFGFERLYFLSLINEADPATAVDIELFDLGEGPNALGAYAGERPPEITPVVEADGMSHLARNALFMARGRYYLRAIGSDETPQVRAQLAALQQAFEEAVAGEPLPWAYALFVGQMGMDPSRIAYTAENAFSFGFANNVYSARLDDDETELFVVAERSADAAARLAGRFDEGFLQYGARATADATVASSDAAAWTRDRYLGAISGAVADGRWVMGVRGAPGVEAAADALAALRTAVQGLPQDVVARSQGGFGAKAAQTLANPEYPDEN